MRVLLLNPPTKQASNVLKDLIYGCWCKGRRIAGAKAPPLSLLTIATIIKDQGHDVKLIDALAEKKEVEEIKNIAKNFDVVIISSSTMSFNEDAELLGILKSENKEIITIVFGSHPTFQPEICLSENSVDIIVQKEPEYIIRDVINYLNQRAKDGKRELWKETKGIGFRERLKIKINPPYPFIENLDELPIPDRNLLPKDLDYFNPIIKRMPYTLMITSRGCPGRCTFCTVPDFYGSKPKARSAEKVIEELKLIQEQKYKEVWIRDETFTYFNERNKEICNRIIKEGIDITWIANARIGTLNKDMMALMKKSGCHLIKFGVESGNQQLLDNVRKGIEVEMTKKTFKWAKEVGIDTHAHIMLGMPGETKETIKKTVRFVKDIEPSTVTFAICTPYPGTVLFDTVIKEHPEILDGSEADLSKVHETTFFNQYFTDLTSRELENYLKKAYRSFYFQPKYILSRLTKISDLDELKRTALAASNVFQFGLRGDK